MKNIKILGSAVTSDGYLQKNVTRRFFDEEFSRISQSGKRTVFKQGLTFFNRRPQKQWGFKMSNGDRYRFFLIGGTDEPVKDFCIEVKKFNEKTPDRKRWIRKDIQNHLHLCN